MNNKLIAYVFFGFAAFILYRQWTRRGTATFGPLTAVEENPYGDPNAETHPPDAIGAPGSDPYGQKSLTGLTEQEEWDALNRLRQTATPSVTGVNPGIPGMTLLFPGGPSVMM